MTRAAQRRDARLDELETRIDEAARRRARAWAARPLDRSVVRVTTEELNGLWENVRVLRTGRIAQQPSLHVIQFESADDAIDAFLSEICVRDFTAHVSTAETREAYASWAAEAGAPEIDGPRLTLALNARGIASHRTKRARLYTGLRLRATSDGDASKSMRTMSSMNEIGETRNSA